MLYYHKIIAAIICVKAAPICLVCNDFLTVKVGYITKYENGQIHCKTINKYCLNAHSSKKEIWVKWIYLLIMAVKFGILVCISPFPDLELTNNQV